MKRVYLQIQLFSSLLAFASISFADTTKFTADFYGRIKASAIYASQPVDSFSFVNPSAPTAASFDQEIASISDQDLLSMQVAQSRIGTKIRKGKTIGVVEADFINFALSSPTTDSRPRLRRAFIKHTLNEKNYFSIGQDWDTFSSLAPNIFNYVGLDFTAGNLGFMRQQLKWHYGDQSSYHEFSLGMTGKNSNPTQGDIEYAKSPLFAYSFAYKNSGISVFHTQLRDSDFGRTSSYGINLFSQKSILGSLVVTTELYYGANLSDAGMQGLSSRNGDEDIKEAGGYINLTYLMEEFGELSLSYSKAKVQNSEDISNFSFDTTDEKITSSGISTNSTARLFWKLPIDERVFIANEISHYMTSRRLNGTSSDNCSTTIESGMLMYF